MVALTQMPTHTDARHPSIWRIHQQRHNNAAYHRELAPTSLLHSYRSVLQCFTCAHVRCKVNTHTKPAIQIGDTALEQYNWIRSVVRSFVRASTVGCRQVKSNMLNMHWNDMLTLLLASHLSYVVRTSQAAHYNTAFGPSHGFGGSARRNKKKTRNAKE